MEARVLFREFEYVGELLVDELCELGLELVVGTEEAKANLLDKGESPNGSVLKQRVNSQRGVCVLELFS